MFAALDTHLFVGVAIAAAFAVALSVFTFLQSERYMGPLAFLAAVAYIGRRLPALWPCLQ